MTELENILSEYDPISLGEMDNVQLLNRVDTKFVLSNNQFLKLLVDLTPFYKALEVNGIRTARYKSLYFDTDELDHYMNHHNGHPNRYKVRIRRYEDSDLCFLEIKHKQKGRTDKQRIKIKDFELNLSDDSVDFISQIMPESKNLKPSLWNSFNRITLVNEVLKERVTFDIGLHYKEGVRSQDDLGYDNIVIAEVKQERENRKSPIMRLLKSYGIRRARVSKYCIGMGLTNPELKQNKFKQKYLLIDKIRQL